MEGLVSLVTCLLVLMVLAIPLVIVYKYRAKIRRWINEPTYGDLSSWEVDGVKRAERGVTKARWRLEDAEDYLGWKKEKDKNKETSED